MRSSRAGGISGTSRSGSRDPHRERTWLPRIAHLSAAFGRFGVGPLRRFLRALDAARVGERSAGATVPVHTVAQEGDVTGSARDGTPVKAPAEPLASYFPGYFAMVMATGIIGIGCRLVGVPVLDVVLLAVAAAAYVVIAVLTTVRLVRYPRRVFAELTSHAKGFAYATAVAATEVLGSAVGILLDWWIGSLTLWWIGLALKKSK